HAGRLINTWHKLDGNNEILLAKNIYNELGQLIDKKLHSTFSDGSDAKQSVDYRYNIRGWLTKINESDLNNSVEAGEARDLFGMELGYNTDIGVSNSLLYNGNISAIKWSNNLSLGDVKENAYTYSYDPMNRLTASTYKQKNGSWASAGNNGFAETGFTYDLNGNILTLQRNDGRTTGWMDNLTYDYGTGATQSNKLLKVTDAGDDFKGFIDGTNSQSVNDYTYDANGNMITDLNKNILVALPIIYNHLNLPEVVNKGTSTIRYTYDATGRKLWQTVSGTGPQKQTDYLGEYVYTNGSLQFVNHEEGRIAMAAEERIFSFDGSHQNGITKTGADVTLTNETNNGETYLKASITSGTTKRGISAFTSPITVTPGDRYVYRVRGYRGGEAFALYVKGNSTDVVWPGAPLPNNINIEAWVETYFVVPPSVTQIELGVMLNTATTATQVCYVNEVQLIKLSNNSTAEYQYHLKDHLGNVRLTFTTKADLTTSTATLENANAATEQSQFVRFAEARKIQSYLFDRTNGSVPSTATGYAQRLNGSANERYGLGKSLSVMPGDVIHASVYAKYIDPVSSNWTTALNTLLSQIAGGTAPAGTVVDGASYSNSTANFPFSSQAAQNTSNSSETGPKVYLNWLVFDRDYNFILAQSGYDRLSTAPKEAGQDVAHELLESPQITIKQPGYVYIFLSNEESAPLEAYFDDFSIDYTKSPVVQQDDYYAFGLNFNSHQRENATGNQYLYNGKERQDELDLGWMDYGARMYIPEIGRWGVVDVLSEKYYKMSPYNYCLNNPIRLVDPDGKDGGVQNGYGYDVTTQSTRVRTVEIKGVKYTEVTSMSNRTEASEFKLTTKDGPVPTGDITKTETKTTSLIDGAGKIVKSAYSESTSFKGEDDKQFKQTGTRSGTVDIEKNKVTFAGGESKSLDENFASDVKNIANFNAKNDVDFPRAAAQNALDGTNDALGTIGLGSKSPVSSVGLFLAGKSLPTAGDIAKDGFTVQISFGFGNVGSVKAKGAVVRDFISSKLE
ncbi:MAG TPA: RHS repeat-associated core domain-containing protein, partial [Cyclobacteriaceae bacterium]|nr:RHS repeat-associated core domain-containing protein [Cyclobacteriaceae bacterium]